MLGQIQAHLDMIFGCRVERRWLRSQEVLQGVGREVMCHACSTCIMQVPDLGLSKNPAYIVLQ
jgi:hypothetical protein